MGGRRRSDKKCTAWAQTWVPQRERKPPIYSLGGNWGDNNVPKAKKSVPTEIEGVHKAGQGGCWRRKINSGGESGRGGKKRNEPEGKDATKKLVIQLEKNPRRARWTIYLDILPSKRGPSHGGFKNHTILLGGG